MEKYVYSLCFLTGTPLLATSGVISNAELESFQKLTNKTDDTIILQDGTAIYGTLKSIPKLEFSFGSLPINVKNVAEIAFSPQSEKNKIQIITHEGYSYIADLPTENFVVVQYLPNRERPQFSIQKEISPENIKYISIKQKSGRQPIFEKRLFDIELKNGDHIPGSITTDTILLSTGISDEKIHTDDLQELEVNFGIHGYTKNKEGNKTEFDYTYAKDKFLNLQIPQSEQTLGLPWALISKIQKVETPHASETTEVETPKDDSLIKELEMAVAKHEEAKGKIGELQEEIQKHIATRESLQTQLQEALKTDSNTKAEKEELQAQYHAATQSLYALQEEIKQHVSSKETLKTELSAEIADLRKKYEHAYQSIESLEDQIQNHIVARENLQTELHAIAEIRAEMEELLMQKGETEEQITLTYNLEAEFAKTKILENQMATLNRNMKATDQRTMELVHQYEIEVKALQELLSGKQRQIQFSEKELADRIEEINKWKELQRESTIANMVVANYALFYSEEEKMMHPVHILSDVNHLMLTIDALNSSLQNPSYEHHVHLVSDIDHLTKAWEHERSHVQSTTRNLKDLEIALASVHESLTGTQTELENNLKAELTRRFEYEEKIADLTDTLEREKVALQQALEKGNAATQFAASLETQLQSLTQKAVAFGDEFAQTKEKLQQTQKELQEYHETNVHLHQQLAENTSKYQENTQQNQHLEEYVTKMTQRAKELEESLAAKTLELDQLRFAYQSDQDKWSDIHTSKDSVHSQNIQELQIALENERNQTRAEIEQLIAAVTSERELTSELGLQLQRVHATETKFKKQLEQQAAKIVSLSEENQAYKEELLVRQEEINKLANEIADLQERSHVVKDYHLDLEAIKQEKDQLQYQLHNEREAAADKTALIDRLSEIVKMQKTALDRIERSQLALKEEN